MKPNNEAPPAKHKWLHYPYIFIQDNHVASCWVNVIETNGCRYYGHWSTVRGMTKAMARIAKMEGRKPLYMVRVTLKGNK